MNLVGNIAASSQLKLMEELIVHYFELSGKIDFSVYLLIKFIFLKIRQKKFFGYFGCCGPTIYATKRASFDDLEPTISAISFKKQTQCKRKGPTIYATRNRRFYICLPLNRLYCQTK